LRNGAKIQNATFESREGAVTKIPKKIKSVGFQDLNVSQASDECNYK
jgi:hypothetical protein